MLKALLLAHLWYPTYCCADRDCKPIDCAWFRWAGNGVVTYLGWEIPKTRIMQSMDDQCHICVSKALGSVQCVFFPGVT